MKDRATPRIVAHSLALLTLVAILADFLAHQADYTANRTLIVRTGFCGLLALVLSLGCSPLARALKQPQIVPLRRVFGLYGFLFVCVHVGAYAWLDNDFALALILRDLGERPSMSVGLAALVVLIPLAFTSTRGWQRRLGRRWRVLHRLVLVALPLSIAHNLLLDRDVFTSAYVFAAIAVIIYAARIWQRVQNKESRIQT